MRAFAVFLARYGNNVMVLIPPPKKDKETPAKKSDKGILSAKTIIEIGNGAAEHPFVLLPVNFGGSHWGGLVVDRAAKLVKTYDSMGGKRNRQRLKKMAGEIGAGPLNDVGFNVCSVEEPMQTDTDSCGVFVCRFFWECVSSEAPTDVSPTGVTKLRWAMLHKIMKTKQR
ncbi:hypothetical protein PF007_g31560 [Phytophthora fragariae]|uniref:Ubiquitin-like protease family profile domain-containing protein n=1 Tax=Phytophthora fragariae TaxID=53985 RepID=A0A6A3PI25_9STRA|nr:hypothetical protein PF003_g1026 [Phytophthora fragariae]KAE9057683.1 hypothetical protein PF007_g31560 [Phytophthora fragariae]